MEFREVLTRTRKARGLSQEELASRLGVSRQAVSKWETGDAQPDLARLVALADALEISLDVLTGRREDEAASPAEKPAAERNEKCAGRVRIWQVLCVLLAVCLLSGGIYMWTLRRSVVESASAQVEGGTLPETFTVTGVSFGWPETATCADYRFVPSVAEEGYTYQITFTGSDNVPHTFDAPYSGGVCAGSAEIPKWDTYSVTATVAEGTSTRGTAVAVNLSFGPGLASWTPVEP